MRLVGRLNLLGGVIYEGPTAPAPPPAQDTLFFFGQTSFTTPAGVDTGALQSFVPIVGTDMMFTISNLVAGNTLWLISPAAIEIDVLRQVLGDGLTGDVLSEWTKIENAGILGVVTADTYQRGPIAAASAGEDITYRVTFVAGA